jgi:RecJ-like exonuclease
MSIFDVPCRHCAGTGEIGADGAHHGRRCRKCRGTGIAYCRCGEPATLRLDGQDVCPDCASEVFAVGPGDDTEKVSNS